MKNYSPSHDPIAGTMLLKSCFDATPESGAGISSELIMVLYKRLDIIKSILLSHH